jgi:hypothetical protein
MLAKRITDRIEKVKGWRLQIVEMKNANYLELVEVLEDELIELESSKPTFIDVVSAMVADNASN